MARKAISKKRRFEIFKRDSFTCQYCGSHPPVVILHLDHIHPVNLGGGSEDDNLVTSCQPCNQGKSATPLSVAPMGLAEKAKLVEEGEAQLAGFTKIMRAAKDRLEDDCWSVSHIFMERFGKDSIPRTYLASIRSFVSKLGVVECEETMEYAISMMPYSESRVFRYFCGVCWNKIKRDQQ